MESNVINEIKSTVWLPGKPGKRGTRLLYPMDPPLLGGGEVRCLDGLNDTVPIWYTVSECFGPVRGTLRLQLL